MDRQSRKIQCVGRRHLEIARDENGYLSLQIIWKGKETLATLVLNKEAARELRDAVTLLVHPVFDDIDLIV